MKIKWRKIEKKDKIEHPQTLTDLFGYQLNCLTNENCDPLTDTGLLFKMPDSDDERKVCLEIINRISTRVDYLQG